MNTTPPLDSVPRSAPASQTTGIECGRKGFSRQAYLVIWIYALVAVTAAAEVFWYNNVIVSGASVLGIAILTTVWAINDCQQRHLAFYRILRLVYLLTSPMSLGVYLLFTRGFRGLGLIAINFVAVLLVSAASFYGVFYAVYYSGFWVLFDPIYFEC